MGLEDGHEGEECHHRLAPFLENFHQSRDGAGVLVEGGHVGEAVVAQERRKAVNHQHHDAGGPEYRPCPRHGREFEYALEKRHGVAHERNQHDGEKHREERADENFRGERYGGRLEELHLVHRAREIRGDVGPDFRERHFVDVRLADDGHRGQQRDIEIPERLALRGAAERRTQPCERHEEGEERQRHQLDGRRAFVVEERYEALGRHDGPDGDERSGHQEKQDRSS